MLRNWYYKHRKTEIRLLNFEEKGCFHRKGIIDLFFGLTGKVGDIIERTLRKVPEGIMARLLLYRRYNGSRWASARTETFSSVLSGCRIEFSCRARIFASTSHIVKQMATPRRISRHDTIAIALFPRSGSWATSRRWWTRWNFRLKFHERCSFASNEKLHFNVLA